MLLLHFINEVYIQDVSKLVEDQIASLTVDLDVTAAVVPAFDSLKALERFRVGTVIDIRVE
jgi:hypothetical protein